LLKQLIVEFRLNQLKNKHVLNEDENLFL
jgi:hypothetical protein